MNNEFKVVRIIDSESIVLNAGYNDGIYEGDKFDIYSVGTEIRDPDTEKVLGTLNNIKERVTVVNIFENMCICKCPVYYNPLANLATKMADLYKADNKQLNVNTQEITNDLDSNKTICIGDKACKVIYEKHIENSKANDN